MNAFIKKAIVVGLGVSLIGNAQINAQQQEMNETLYESVKEETIATGLVYERKEKLTDAGWVDIHVLKIDMTNESLSLDILRDAETFALRENVSDMVDESVSNYIGGINGSFFSMGTMLGEVEGVEVEDKKIVYGIDDYNFYSQKAANLLVDTDGKPFFDFLNLSLAITTDGGSNIRIQGVNSHSVFGDPMIFNREAYEDMDYVDTLDDLYKVVIENDKVVKITKEKEHIVIPEDGYVITFPVEDPNNYRQQLAVGTTVTLNTTTNYDLEKLQLALPGGGYLIKNGILSDEGLIVGKEGRYPRTAIGATEDGTTLIAMVVDGRGESIGATHRELANYLLEYGVYNAIHLDGGGSSTIVAKEPGDFNNSTMNTPSDGQERGVINGLGVVLTAPKTEEFDLILKSDKNRVFINNKVNLSLSARDLNYNPVEVDENQVVWTMTGNYGTVENMTFIPSTAGVVELTAYYKGKSESIKLTVADQLIDLEISPKIIHADDGQQKLTVIGTDENGYKSVIDSDLLSWTVDPSVGEIENGIFTPISHDKTAEIMVSYGDVKEFAYVISGETQRVLTDFIDEKVSTLVYPETVVGNAEVVNEGKAMLQIDYQFEASETTQAVYAVFEDLTINSSVDQIAIEVADIPSDILIKGHINDRFEEQYTITFEKVADGKLKANVPENLAYPLSFTRLYAVTLGGDTQIDGSLKVKSIITSKKNDISSITDAVSIQPKDSLYNDFPEDGYEIKLFGATSGRNRLLDDVVMSKVYDQLNTADFSIYAGNSEVDRNNITNEHFIYNNQFEVTDLEDARIISLAMSEGSMVKTDSGQWRQLNSALSSTAQDTLIIIGTEKLLNNTDKSFTREGELIHQTMSNLANISGKKIFYVNASGYNYSLSFYEGIRYIDLNGLWYSVKDNKSVDLYNSFKTVTFNFANGEMSYKVDDLYPRTTIGE